MATPFAPLWRRAVSSIRVSSWRALALIQAPAPASRSWSPSAVLSSNVLPFTVPLRPTNHA
jgi:hypothetical protein